MAMDWTAMILEAPPHLASVVIWLCAGGALGAVYFVSLRWNVALFTQGRLIAPIALQMLRFAVVTAALGSIALGFGAMPLLSAAAGLIAARVVMLRLEAQS